MSFKNPPTHRPNSARSRAAAGARAPLLCEIRAPDDVATNLARIVAFCARQSGQTLDIVTRAPDAREVMVTLHVPPGDAAGDRPVFCFICRLACLCPQARVGVFVPAQDLFVADGVRRTG